MSVKDTSSFKAGGKKKRMAFYVENSTDSVAGKRTSHFIIFVV